MQNLNANTNIILGTAFLQRVDVQVKTAPLTHIVVVVLVDV
jgi:hypothetical protein